MNKTAEHTLSVWIIVKVSVRSLIDIDVPTRALLAGETEGPFVRWLANLNVKRNLTSMFVNRYLPFINFVYCSDFKRGIRRPLLDHGTGIWMIHLKVHILESHLGGW